MKNSTHTCWCSLFILTAFVVPAGAQEQLPRPLPVYFLEFRTDFKTETRLAEDLTDALNQAFSARRPIFRVIDRRNIGEIERQIAANLQAGQKPPASLVSNAKSAYGFIRGELFNRDDGAELRVTLVGLNSDILWMQRKTHTLLKWKDGEIRQSDAEWFAADAQARLFPPDNQAPPGAADGAGGIAAARDGDCRRAMPLLDNAAAVDTENPEIHYWLAHCHNQAGEYALAADSATRGLLIKQRADLFIERAISLQARSQTGPTITNADQALRLEPGNTRALEIKGDALMRQGHYGEATNYFNAAYQSAPNKTNCMKLAEAYRKDGTPSEAATIEAACRSLR